MSKVRRIEFITGLARAQNRRTEAGLPFQMMMRLLGLGTVVATAGVALRTRARTLRLIGATAELPTDMDELARLCSPIVEKVHSWALKDYVHLVKDALVDVGLSSSDSRAAAKLVHALEQIVLLLDFDHASPLGARLRARHSRSRARLDSDRNVSRRELALLAICLLRVDEPRRAHSRQRRPENAKEDLRILRQVGQAHLCGAAPQPLRKARLDDPDRRMGGWRPSTNLKGGHGDVLGGSVLPVARRCAI